MRLRDIFVQKVFATIFFQNSPVVADSQFRLKLKSSLLLAIIDKHMINYGRYFLIIHCSPPLRSDFP